MNLQNNPYYYYYSVDDRIFSSKFLALATTSNNKDRHIKFHIPNIESAFLSLDLYKEPEESLQQLYKERAIQLRNDYDYLVLFYSGGYDSHNILETFMRNNIFLDEIVIANFIDTSDKKNLELEKINILAHEGRGFEVEKSAIPLANFYVNNFSPHTKITYFSKILQEHINFWTDNENFRKNKMNFINVSELIGNRPIWRSINPNLYNLEWRKIRETKKVAFIWGREKPDIKQDDIGYFFHFNDSLFLNCYNTEIDLCLDNQPLYHEYFYIHPKAVKMYIKQAHVMIKKFPNDFFTKTNMTLDTRKFQDQVSNIIYDIRIPIPYTELKTCDLFLKFLNNRNAYPNLMKVAETIGLENIKTTGPYISSTFLENNTMQAAINHKKYINFIRQNFPISLNELSFLYMTDKFYFKNHV